ncbi:DUF2490 domain-containing protein [Roseivirga sp.]|uniref:DUF2490 domain-containing protein n=1 Tax=Roseivirga sp. TaxID=1964215 RepID=UPI003B5289A9
MKKFLILFCLFTGWQSISQAQSTSDFELWLKLGGKADLSEKWRLNMEQQIRFDENVGAVKNYHTELELVYRANSKVDLFFVPRFIRRNDNSGDTQGYENLFRFQLGGAYEHESGQFEFKHRLLFQHRNELGIKKDEGDVPELFVRYKINTEYKIKDWKYDPEFSVEYFQAIDQEFADNNNSIRFAIGTERDYDRFGELGIDYMIDLSLGLAIREVAHILSFKYTYVF